MLTVRPRPAYIFVLGITGALVAAMSGLAFMRRFRWVTKAEWVLPIAALAMIVLVPRYYNRTYGNGYYEPGQPVARTIERLYPYRSRFSPAKRAVVPGDGAATCFYLAVSPWCGGVNVPGLLIKPWISGAVLLHGFRTGDSLKSWLDSEQVTDFYADEQLIGVDPVLDGLFTDPGRYGFRQTAAGSGWLLLERADRQ
jgi:hypothetical protein